MPPHATPDRNPCADLDAIRAKAETFFEWPDDAGEKPRDYVTFTSCLLFARDCVNDWRAQHHDILAFLEELDAVLKQDKALVSWQPVDTAPTDTPVLATYLDDAGKPKVIRAELIGRYTQEASPEWDCTDYNEATDTYYRAAGWVELMDHWDDHNGCYIHATIIGWMPLPQPMETPA